jgi:hypothetical protein
MFVQAAAVHATMGRGCPKCGRIKQASAQTYTQDDFLRLATKVHGDRYDYSQTVYQPRGCGKEDKVTIICSLHGVFAQTPHAHLSGAGCPACKIMRLKEAFTLATNEFIRRARAVHREMYDYSFLEYRSMKERVRIVCPTHGPFWQIAETHLDGSGCPRCKFSTGQRAVSQFLDDNGIEYETEKRFSTCKREYRLPFDFYLPAYHVLIEYDGEQHFVAARWFTDRESAIRALTYVQENDKIKTEWARANDVPLYRIRYDENVGDRMASMLEQLTKAKQR